MKNNVVLRRPIGFDEYFDRKELIKVVNTTSNEVLIDLNQNIKGRGCYIKKDIESFNKIVKKQLINKSLRCKVDSSIYDMILEIIKKEAK